MFWRCVKLILLYLLCFFCFNSCVTSTFVENIDSIAKTHKTIAIIPPKVATCVFPDTVDIGSFYEMGKQKCTYYLQKYAYEEYLKNKGKYFVDIQDIKTTNFLLSEKSIFYDDLEKIDCRTLADLLGVDAVFHLKFGCGRTTSSGRPNAGYVPITTTYTTIEGILFTTNQNISKVTGSMTSNDCYGISAMKSLIRKTIRQLPYRK